MNLQKYVFVVLLHLFCTTQVWAQCLNLPHATNQQFSTASKIIEGKVVRQHSYRTKQGKIFTENHIQVHRVLKGQAHATLHVITEGGIHNNIMQIVTPSVQLQVGQYGLLVLQDNPQRHLPSLTTAFYTINPQNGTVYGLPNIHHRKALYQTIARFSHAQEVDILISNPPDVSAQLDRTTPSISSIFPLDVSAGTKNVLTISGNGFGSEQGTGHVAFSNADDGGQSFVSLQPGPHYISWSDTAIELYVPSAALFNTTVAGSGTIRVVNANGNQAQSTQHLTVNYAKSEVIFENQLSNTIMVAMQAGGYSFRPNHQLVQLAQQSQAINHAFLNWACNTGVNLSLNPEPINITDWAHDQINIIGLANPGQLPSYLLGKTITTFSGCATENGLQWNLIEIDILINSDINWATTQSQPPTNAFDLQTVVLHELGHALLLQHNNDLNAPMYFQLTEGDMRRELQHPSIEGGSYVSTQSAQAVVTCGDQPHQYFDINSCNFSIINGVEEQPTQANSVYPNPFHNHITIAGNNKPGTQLYMLDATGRTVVSETLKANTQSINTNNLAPGIYLLKVHDKTNSYVQHLIKN